MVTVDADAGWMPLYLSTIAGMSTCLGALIVFCHPLEDDDDDIHHDFNNDAEQATLTDVPARPARRRRRRKVSPSTMAFSLALAGSVMVTVSVVSIGPECLAASSMPQNAARTDLDAEDSFFTFGITLMPVRSLAFLQRLLAFAAGCVTYFVLTKCALPEPSEVASMHWEGVPAASSMTSAKSSDDEDSDVWTAAESHANESVEDVRGAGEHAAEASLRSPLQRRGVGAAPAEATTSATSSVKHRGASRRPPAERLLCCGRRFESCVSSLRAFARGSDLATPEARRANRVAMLLFVSLLIHNFPEGLAVAASALESDKLGLTVTIGIMIHNIPEGIAIAIPCLKARPDSPWLCFLLASASGLAEPAGAFVSLALLRGAERRHAAAGGEDATTAAGQEEGGGGGALQEGVLENTLAFVAGIMITVSFLELFPEAKHHTRETGGARAYYLGLVAGFVVMIATEFGMSL